jgi:hypothetical protein
MIKVAAKAALKAQPQFQTMSKLHGRLKTCATSFLWLRKMRLSLLAELS